MKLHADLPNGFRRCGNAEMCRSGSLQVDKPFQGRDIGDQTPSHFAFTYEIKIPEENPRTDIDDN
jgi:hypothetical protein